MLLIGNANDWSLGSCYLSSMRPLPHIENSLFSKYLIVCTFYNLDLDF